MSEERVEISRRELEAMRELVDKVRDLLTSIEQGSRLGHVMFEGAQLVAKVTPILARIGAAAEGTDLGPEAQRVRNAWLEVHPMVRWHVLETIRASFENVAHGARGSLVPGYPEFAVDMYQAAIAGLRILAGPGFAAPPGLGDELHRALWGND